MPTLLDLFSGCGGLTLGAQLAGFRTEVAVDVDQVLTSSFGVNFPESRLVNVDAAELDGPALRSLLPNGVDGIVGGPPCQAFSEIGRREPDDVRRTLVWHFFRIVSLIQPSFFVMENVRGLTFSNNRPLLDVGLAQLGGRWEIVGPVLLDAADFGAPTRRRRLFVFGFDRERADVPSLAELVAGTGGRTTVREAIADLDEASEVGIATGGFDLWRYTSIPPNGRYASRMRSASCTFTGHRRTAHAETTVRRFALVQQGATDLVGRHPRLQWDGICPALRAGTGKDRGSYQAVRPLHPAENRVITPREAARLQGFPDDFLFHPTVWHSFRMIGNSVSPIIAEAILTAIRPRFEATGSDVLAAE